MQTQAPDSGPARGFQPETASFDDAIQDERALVRQNRAKSRHLLEQSVPIAGTLGDHYLRAHRLSVPSSLRFHPAIWSRTHELHLPAIISDVRYQGEGAGVGVLATLIDSEKLEQIEQRAIGLTWGCAVYLAPPAPAMLLAPGIEAALAAGAAHSLPAMSAVMALRNVSLPRVLQSLTIAIDRTPHGTLRDAAQLEAFFACHAGHGTSVRFIPPPGGHATWRAAARAGAVEVAA
jgi:hypothetical protein